VIDNGFEAPDLGIQHALPVWGELKVPTPLVVFIGGRSFIRLHSCPPVGRCTIHRCEKRSLALLGGLGVNAAVDAIDPSASTGRAFHIRRAGFRDGPLHFEWLFTVATDVLIDRHLTPPTF
jgi:hypothetical protein